MLRTVLVACADAGLEASVLTSDPRIAAAAPARVIAEDPALSGLNAQLERASKLLDGDALLVLHADLPLANCTGLAAFVAAHPPGDAVSLVCSRDGGTPALLVSPPARFPFHYGPGSFERHRSSARAAGYTVIAITAPELAFDLDGIEDIRALLASEAGRSTPAGELLQALGVPSRLKQPPT